MNEKKKVIIGFGAVLAGAFAASWFTTYGDYKKDEGESTKVYQNGRLIVTTGSIQPSKKRVQQTKQQVRQSIAK